MLRFDRMNDVITPAQDATRTIVLLYGITAQNAPFWVFVAVKPSRYSAFQQAQKAGGINLQEFEEYGEIIVSGDGNSPPDHITLKVAEMYQTDPSVFLNKKKD